MKYSCIRKCQYRNGSKTIRLASVGDVVDFADEPFKENWFPLEAKDVDFLAMSEAELMNATWPFTKAFEAVQKEFGVDLKKTEKADIVSQIIDARFRQVD